MASNLRNSHLDRGSLLAIGAGSLATALVGSPSRSADAPATEGSAQDARRGVGRPQNR